MPPLHGDLFVLPDGSHLAGMNEHSTNWQGEGRLTALGLGRMYYLLGLDKETLE
jgi:hypothetical protein